MTVALPEPDLCEVWEEHLPALRLFIAMQSQWREGFNGATGLDYSALPVVERRLRLTREQGAAAFPHLQVMEAAALRHFRETAG